LVDTKGAMELIILKSSDLFNIMKANTIAS